MYCANCGNEIQKNVKFCSKCGNSVGAVAATKENSNDIKQISQKRKKHKKIIILISVLGILLAGGITTFVIIWQLPINRFDRAMERENYSEAVEIYNEADYDARKEMAEKMSNMINDSYEDYRNNKITYDEAMDILNKVQHMEAKSVAEQLEETFDKMELMYDSKKSYVEADKAFESEDFGKAYTLYNKVLYEDAYFESAQDKVKNAKNQYIEKVLASVEECKDSQNYSAALELLSTASNIVGKSEKIDEQIGICNSLFEEKNIDQIIAQTDGMVESGNYIDAIRTMNNALFSYSGNEKLIQVQSGYYQVYTDSTIDIMTQEIAEGRFSDAINSGSKTLELLESCSGTDEYVTELDAKMIDCYSKWSDSYIAVEDYENAIRILDSAVRAYSDNLVLSGTRQDYINTYVEKVIQAANSAVAAKDYTLAINLCDIATGVVGNNSVINDEIVYINSMKPVYLDTLEPVNFNCWEYYKIGTTIKDSLGNKYNDYFNAAKLVASAYSDAYAEYYLGKKYITISGCIMPDEYFDKNDECVLAIYADDICVYRSQLIGRKTTIIDFSVDISGAEFIKIVIDEGSGRIDLLNLKLEK